jgi:hypothetical protein
VAMAPSHKPTFGFTAHQSFPPQDGDKLKL